MSTTEKSASSTGGSSSGGDTASPPAPCSAGASEASQAAPLQPLRRAETTVDGGRGHKHVSVTLLEPTNVKKKLAAWCWQFVSRITPSINGMNDVCLVKRDDDTPCNHLMTWAPSSSEGGKNQKGTGTSGLNSHIQKKHPNQYKASNPVPAPVVEPAEPATKKKKYSRREKRRMQRVQAEASGGGGGSGGDELQPTVTERRVVIGREVLVYLAEARHPDVNSFNLLGFWNRRVPTAYYARRRARSHPRRKCPF